MQSVATDPKQRWPCIHPFAQNRGSPALGHDTSCIGDHVVCEPDSSVSIQKELFVWLPGEHSIGDVVGTEDKRPAWWRAAKVAAAKHPLTSI